MNIVKIFIGTAFLISASNFMGDIHFLEKYQHRSTQRTRTKTMISEKLSPFIHKNILNKACNYFGCVYIKPTLNLNEKLVDYPLMERFPIYENIFKDSSSTPAVPFYKSNLRQKKMELWPLIGKVFKFLASNKTAKIHSEFKPDIKQLIKKFESVTPSEFPQLKPLFKTYDYKAKWLYPQLLLNLLTSMPREGNPVLENPALKEKYLELCFALESLNLALFLHRAIEDEDSLFQNTNLMEKFFLKQLTDRKLILAGDFFHGKASGASSYIGLVEFPQYFSFIEEGASKGVLLRDKLKKEKHPKLSSLLEIMSHEVPSLVAYSFLCAGIFFFGQEQPEKLDKCFQAGLHLGFALQLADELVHWVVDYPGIIYLMSNNKQNKLFEVYDLSLPNIFISELFSESKVESPQRGQSHSFQIVESRMNGLIRFHAEECGKYLKELQANPDRFFNKLELFF